MYGTLVIENLFIRYVGAFFVVGMTKKKSGRSRSAYMLSEQIQTNVNKSTGILYR